MASDQRLVAEAASCCIAFGVTVYLLRRVRNLEATLAASEKKQQAAVAQLARKLEAVESARRPPPPPSTATAAVQSHGLVRAPSWGSMATTTDEAGYKTADEEVDVHAPEPGRAALLCQFGS